MVAGGGGREDWRHQVREAVGEQGRRVAEGVREAGRQGSAYGVRGGPAFQPGGYGRGEAVDVPYGEQ
ncbi:hypothetical protein TPA0598_02_03410 [Streptomyces lydicamycinicus]|uniref:Uncharacterized protein n=1 Tax=Streptomyces lydicamycinicus TaxID=1546107 RepID=A0A0P4R4D7_9ACTN|nr:hypothetical protein TPA0598_02_03410 [Streptomyces lydicamycinicus]